MRHWHRPAACGLLAASLLAAAGCGAPGRAEGRVTFGGKPVAAAALTFSPASNPDAPATGVTDDDGRYRLDYGTKGGVAPGKCTIRITRYLLPNGQPLPTGEQGAALRGDESKSVRETYVFERDVAGGSQVIDFDLSDGKKE